MNPRQAKSDEQDNKRVMGWGVTMVVVLVILALLGLYWVTMKGRSPVPGAAAPATQSAPANPPPAAKP